MSDQKFHKGDHVMIAKDLGDCMSHFDSNCEAIVLGSYKDFYWDDGSPPQYKVFIKHKAPVAWYMENQLSMIQQGAVDLLEKWELEREQEIKEKSDLDWIFEHGNEVWEKPHGASLQALADCLNFGSLWGSRGEGVDLYNNGRLMLALAEKFLKDNDKIGWLEACPEIENWIRSTAKRADDD